MLNKKTIIAAIKKTINTNTVLPILEDIYLHEDGFTVTDLETFVTIPFQSGINACIPSKQFLDCMEMMKDVSFSLDYPLVEKIDDKGHRVYDENGPVMEPAKVPGVVMSEGKRRVKVAFENPDDFPHSNLTNSTAPLFHEIGHLSADMTDRIDTALKFVSKDDLRPAMTGINFDDHIAATDAHRLYFHPIEPMMESFIMPAKTARILQVFGGSWQVFYGAQYQEYKNWHTKISPDNKRLKVIDGIVYQSENEDDNWTAVRDGATVALLNEDGVLVVFRPIDARFPQYKVVIPQGKGEVTFKWKKEPLMQEIKNCVKFANKSTNQVTLNLNGVASVYSCDVDFGYEYENELEGAGYQGEIKIGFNGNFMNQILGELPKGEEVRIKMWSPTKAMIVNDEFLIMPLMLNK